MHWKGAVVYASISLETFKSGCGCFCGPSGDHYCQQLFLFYRKLAGRWLWTYDFVSDRKKYAASFSQYVFSQGF